MSEQLTLTAETRERAGKGASRAHRRSGRVPAVIYGAGEAPASIHVEEKVLVKAMSGGHFMNSIVMIETGAGSPARTLPKAVQFHPVTDRPIHVDFLRIGEHSKVTVSVPLRFTDEEQSPGLEAGGVLNAVMHELSISVDAADIPGDIPVSLAGLEVGGSIHLSQVQLPGGAVATLTDPDATVATVAAPKVSAADEAADAEAPAADEVPSEQGSAEADAEGNTQ